MRKAALVFTLTILLTAGVWADSLFNATAASTGTLVAKQKDYAPGDIIQVLVEETIEANVRANTNTKKESDVGSESAAGENTFLTSNSGLNILNEEELPNWAVQMKNETKARGETLRRSTLATTVSCIVTKVSSNGLLAIEGDKNVSMNREDCRLHISGTIRTKDITPANTVRSDQIANAVIELKGRGPLWNNQRRGLITRLLDWVSPF